MTGGDFTQDAYQQLQAAYADSLSTQEEQEQAGREILGQRMSLETMPVDSPWRDKIKDWQYPNGKSEYLDGKQSPEEILELMRQSVTEKQAEKEAEDEITDEELDLLLDEILNEDNSDEESDEEDEPEESDEAEEEDEDDEVDLSGLTEDEINTFLAENPDYELVTEDDEEEEVEEEEVEEEEAKEEYDEEEEEVDPEEVATQIAELKEQIESFRFSNISDEDVEE